jgi:hypothetical protein
MNMKTFFSVVFSLWILVSYAQHPFAYLSPVPNSTFNHAGSTIIIHPGYVLTETDVNLIKSTVVIGSQSGLHQFDVVVAKQGKAAILKFKEKFRPAESVSVTFSPLLKGKNGSTIGNYKLNYAISKVTEQDRIRLRNSTNVQLEIPNPPREEDVTRTQDETYNQYLPAADGYVFITNTVIRRMDGSVVKDLTASGNAFRRVNDTVIGHTTYGGVYLYNEDYSNHHRYTFIKNTPEDNYSPEFHDFLITHDNNAFMLGVDTVVMDLSAYPNGDTNHLVRAMVIEEIDRETDELVWLWKTIDYLKPWESSLNAFNGDFVDYVHCNALSYDTDGNVVLASPVMREVTKIEYPAGNVIWRMGGKKNQFTFVGDQGFLSHHHAVIAENGNLTMFDNGKARAVEYQLDQTNKTATKVWDMINPAGAPSPFYGSHQILPNGNRFISWGYVQTNNAHPVVSEIAPDGSTVFDIIKTSGFGGYYRAYKYTWKLAKVGLSASQTEYVKTEGDVSTITANVNLSRQSNCEVRLSMSPTSTLSADDVTITPSTLAFQDTSSVTSRSFTISVNDDAIAEYPEWAQLVLTNVTGGCPLLNDTIKLTVIDNELATATPIQSTTSDESADMVSNSITIDVPRNCTLTATPDWANSTASPDDVEIMGNTIEFTTGSTDLTQSFTFHILEDTIDEAQEILLVNITATGDCDLAMTSTQVIIDDNDIPLSAYSVLQNAFEVAPNPVTSMAVVTFKQSPDTFTLYDAKGAKLYYFTQPSTLRLDMASLPKGTYNAVATYGTQALTKSIVKQ